MKAAHRHALEAPPGARAALLPAHKGIRAGISLAAAGDMARSKGDILPHRARFIESLGISPGDMCMIRQVHSREILVIDQGATPGIPAGVADGMITARTDVLLTVTVADCLPILLFDLRTGAFGLVHSGWKGTGIAVEALRLMGSIFGSRPKEVRVTIGPGIGACCYAVPQERAERFAAEFGAGSVTRARDGQTSLDLRAANVSLLGEAGVEDITVVSNCTCCTPWLGSYRRQGPHDYTLMLAYVGAEKA